MTRCFQQVLAAWLAVTLALAGAVAVSPILHRLIEHGGEGPDHTHFGSAAQAHSHGNDSRAFLAHPHDHSHSANPDHHHHYGGQSGHSHGLLDGGMPECLWRALAHWMAHLVEESSDSSSSPEDPGHTHDSLPQMLLSGLIEQHLEAPLIFHIPLHSGTVRFTVGTSLPDRNFDPQTASRPPPVVLS